jgi:mRNA interferase RelE/StbE
VKYVVELSEAAGQDLAALNSRTREACVKRIVQLEQDAEIQGKPLVDELFGYRAIKLLNRQYRIIFEVRQQPTTVLVVVVGIRREGDKSDVYQIAKHRLLR